MFCRIFTPRPIILLLLCLLLIPSLLYASIKYQFWPVAKDPTSRKQISSQHNPVVTSSSLVASKQGSHSSESGEQNSDTDSTYADPVTGMEFVWIPGGCFMMGSPASEKGRDDDEGPVHKVCVDGFYMGKYEVTQKQWRMLMGSNPSYFKGDNRPVEAVLWDDVQEYIRKLNNKSGKHYRLPTEAEWEYACRAGTTTVFSFGDSIRPEQAYCSYTNVYGPGYTSKFGYRTAPVGSTEANAFGLFDMHGNVWEWCNDWYDDDYYANSPQDNPPGPLSGGHHVMRGGSFDYAPVMARSANRVSRGAGWKGVLGSERDYGRNWYVAEDYYDDIGFRLVLSDKRQ